MSRSPSLLHRRSWQRRFTALMILAVLWAQWLGLEHAVIHAAGSGQTQVRFVPGLSPGSSSAGWAMDVSSALDRIFGDDAVNQISGIQDDDQGAPHSHHSCVAFDTATLGASAPAALWVQPVCTLTGMRAESRIPEFYLPLFAALFNSRAPPSASHPA